MNYYYPLIDIKEAIADADRNLADAMRYICTLQAETNGTYPPGGKEALTMLQALRLGLELALPDVLMDAISAEQLLYQLGQLQWEN